MAPDAWVQVAAGLPMPGVLAVALAASYPVVSEDIIPGAVCNRESEWGNQVELLAPSRPPEVLAAASRHAVRNGAALSLWAIR